MASTLRSDGLQPTSDGLTNNIVAMASTLGAMVNWAKKVLLLCSAEKLQIPSNAPLFRSSALRTMADVYDLQALCKELTCFRFFFTQCYRQHVG